jgi:exodeoxyribonuclease VIII
MHLMIDLETMGKRPNAPIIAIGAVLFDRSGVTSEFYQVVDLQSSVDAGAVIDASTVLWWMGQSDAARGEFGKEGSVSLQVALAEFRAYMNDVISFRGLLDGVWGNGAAFDNVITREAYRNCGLEAPWPFWLDRCYRTVKHMYPHVAMHRAGELHNAVDDARSQAQHLIAIDEAAADPFL